MSDEQLVIASGAHSPYSIVVADEASPSVRYAAEELQRFLNQMSGALLPIVSDTTAQGDNEILLGDNLHTRHLDLRIDSARLGPEGYVLRAVGEHLVIVGSPIRGVLYGVYGLLEDKLGCRWFTPTVSRIPKRDRVAIGPLDEVHVPALEYREPYVIDCVDGDWCARNRVNSNESSLGERHGGKVAYSGFDHTFHSLLSPDQYYDEHPEYFSEVNGRRLREETQLCFTNEDVIALVTEAVRARLRENPRVSVVSVSQMDWGNYCQCSDCSAMTESEGSPAGPLLYMVNRVAEGIAEEFPDKAVDTLAYQWSLRPPRTMRPRSNVIVRLCTGGCCFSHPIASCESRGSAEFRSIIREWAKLSRRLWIWDYTTSFSNYFVPYPNLRVLDDNIRFFIRNGVTGVFEEDNWESPNGEFSPLGGYLMAKFLWNPGYDEDTAINEFLEGVYGAAAGPIRRYIDLLHDKVEDENIHIGLSEGQWAPYLTDDLLAAADLLWDEAEAAVADQPEVLKRVRAARLSLDCVVLQRTKASASGPYRVRGGRYTRDVDPGFAARGNRFLAVAEGSGVTTLREFGQNYGMLLSDFRNDIESLSRSYPVVTLKSDSLQLQIVPELGGRLVDLRLMPGGDNLCRTLPPDTIGYPNVGGYAEIWNGGPGGPGWRDAFAAAVDRSAEGTTASLSADLRGGTRLQRAINVPREGRAFQIRTTLTNLGTKAQPGDLRTVLSLDLGDTDDVAATLPAMGDSGAIALALPESEATRSVSFSPSQVAQGIVVANRERGVGVRISVDSEGIDRALLRVDAKRSAVTVEFWIQGALQPHESRTIEQRLEVLAEAGVPPRRDESAANAHRALRVIVQEDETVFDGYGQLVSVERDERATNGYSIRMRGDHRRWCCEWPFQASQLEVGQTYDVYARVRVARTGERGRAFAAQIWESTTWRLLSQVSPTVQDAGDGGWQLHKIGSVTVDSEHETYSLYCLPVANAENVAAVWLDYFELIAAGSPGG